MKRWISLLMLILFSGLAACQSAPVTAEAVQPAGESSPSFSLEVVGPSGSKTFTLDELKQMTAFESFAGFKSSTGAITPPMKFKGVAILDLLNAVGGLDNSMGVSVEAKDGYAITYSYDQIISGNFITYDPGTGDENTVEGTKTVLIAYDVDGKPINPETEGPLRLVVAGSGMPVTDGHWAVKWVTKITIKAVSEDWAVHLEGAINELMDRATFESGASPNCHLTSWVDGDGNEWSGIPLYYLVGRIDDEIKHEGPAFNDELAKTDSYTVEVVAKDGYSVTFDNFRVMRNDNIIVANLVNGDSLEEGVFPLKLVGSELKGNEMVGSIEKILVHFGEAIPTATAEPAVEAAVQEVVAVEGSLVIGGKVEQAVTLSLDEFLNMEQKTITTKHPKKDEMVDYTGVFFSDLLPLVKPAGDASVLVLTASDGYTSEVKLSDLAACENCMVAYNEEDKYLIAVFPGLESSLWVKYLATIEIR